MQSKTNTHYLIFGILLFILVVYIFLMFFTKSKSIQWKNYNTHEINIDLQSNKVILISVVASLGSGTVYHEYKYIRQPSVEKLILSQNISCYRVDLAETPEDEDIAWRDTFNNQTGFGMILLRMDSKNEIISQIIPYEKMSEKRVISEIEMILKN